MCPYIADKMSRNLYVEIDKAPTIRNSLFMDAADISPPHEAETTDKNNNIPASSSQVNILIKSGFRRSQNFFYKPICNNCNACQPIRIKANEFNMTSKNKKRCDKKNNFLSMHIGHALGTIEHYILFRRYVEARHKNGGMASMEWLDFINMIETAPLATKLYDFKDETGKLYASMIVDEMKDGLSAVYSFFDPDFYKNSLGKWMVYQLINHCNNLGKKYVYLGYWIKEFPQMDYKKSFKPSQIFTASGWIDISCDYGA